MRTMYYNSMHVIAQWHECEVIQVKCTLLWCLLYFWDTLWSDEKFSSDQKTEIRDITQVGKLWWNCFGKPLQSHWLIKMVKCKLAVLFNDSHEKRIRPCFWSSQLYHAVLTPWRLAVRLSLIHKRNETTVQGVKARLGNFYTEGVPQHRGTQKH